MFTTTDAETAYACGSRCIIRRLDRLRVLFRVDSRTDYASEAAVHPPVRRQPFSSQTEPTRAVLAGLKGKGRAMKLVSAWRNHIHPGEPQEGVISVPGEDY